MAMINADYVVAQKSGTYVDLYVDRPIGQVWKRLTAIITVNGGRVEHLNIVFDMTRLTTHDCYDCVVCECRMSSRAVADGLLRLRQLFHASC